MSLPSSWGAVEVSKQWNRFKNYVGGDVFVY